MRLGQLMAAPRRRSPLRGPYVLEESAAGPVVPTRQMTRPANVENRPASPMRRKCRSANLGRNMEPNNRAMIVTYC